MASLQRTLQSETPKQRKRRLNNERQATHYKKKQKTKQDSISIRRHELGRINQICIHCNAKFWIEEKDGNSPKPHHLLLYAVLVVKSVYRLYLIHHHI